MSDVTVTPETWQFVDFDGHRIATVSATLLEQIGLRAPLRIEVDETTPLARAKMLSLDPLVLDVESGAFEDPKRPRQLSERQVADVLGLLLFRASDRLDGGFGEVPPDDGLNVAQSTAWDVYAVGRFARLGYPVQRQRRLYYFRNRHGFSDTADAAFERLWTADRLTWDDILAVCDETAATRAPVR